MAFFSKDDTLDPRDLLAQRRFKEAAKLLERRLKRNPNDLKGRLMLAEAFEGLKRDEDATAIYVQEAEARLSSGDKAAASALFKKALKLNAGDNDLAERLRALDGSGETHPGGAFSFDLADAAPPADVDAPAAEGSEEVRAPLVGPGELVEAELPVETGDLEPPPEPFHESGEGVYATLRGLMPDLPGDDLGHLAACVSERVVAPGDVLVREGEAGGALFIISRGRFEVRGSFDGVEMSLGSLGRGDVVGEVSLLQHVPRTATVTALEPGMVMEIDGEKAGRLLDENPSMRGRLSDILDERVRRTLDLLKEKGTEADGDPRD